MFLFCFSYCKIRQTPEQSTWHTWHKCDDNKNDPGPQCHLSKLISVEIKYEIRCSNITHMKIQRINNRYNHIVHQFNRTESNILWSHKKDDKNGPKNLESETFRCRKHPDILSEVSDTQMEIRDPTQPTLWRHLYSIQA